MKERRTTSIVLELAAICLVVIGLLWTAYDVMLMLHWYAFAIFLLMLAKIHERN